MKRTMILGVAILTGWLASESVSLAQVFIRAPFVRVAVGNGVAVRAPFVNLFIPSNAPPYYPPYQVYDPLYGSMYLPPPNVPQMPPANSFSPPTPQPLPQTQNQQEPPLPIQGAQPATPTLEAFSKSFQPKAGSYQITILNPVTRQPTAVRFALPEGTPRRVRVTRDSIEFIYGLRQFVRIEFDRDGVMVTTR